MHVESLAAQSSTSFGGRLPGAFTTPGNSSFTDFLRLAAPTALTQRLESPGGAGELVPHGTTIVAATFPGGVVMAGDRRATMGNLIANRDMIKVFPADEHSVVGCAGTAGIAVELARLFCVELEHYEKIEGIPLSLDGKANRLASMIRGNLSLALQGLAAVPLFAGYDLDADVEAGEEPGRIFSYDVAGSVYPEDRFAAVGSGSIFAKSALKKRYVSDASAAEMVRLCVEALYDAADDDSATGGPDLARKIYPVITVVQAEGVKRWGDDEVGQVVEAVVAGRMEKPGG